MKRQLVSDGFGDGIGHDVGEALSVGIERGADIGNSRFTNGMKLSRRRQLVRLEADEYDEINNVERNIENTYGSVGFRFVRNK